MINAAALWGPALKQNCVDGKKYEKQVFHREHPVGERGGKLFSEYIPEHHTERLRA